MHEEKNNQPHRKMMTVMKMNRLQKRLTHKVMKVRMKTKVNETNINPHAIGVNL